MKKFIGFSLLVLGLALTPCLSFAANEPAVSDGAFGLGEVGFVTNSSTGGTVTGRSGESRKIQVTNDGTQIFNFAVHRTTFSGVVSSTAQYPRDIIASSAPYTFGTIDLSSGIFPNMNVLATASALRPVLLRRLRVGDGATTNGGLTTVQIWDSRGSTSAPSVVQIFNESVTTGSVRDLDLWISSGITRWIMVPTGSAAGQNPGRVWLDWEEYNTNNQDAR